MAEGGEGVRSAADGTARAAESDLRSVVVHAEGAVCTRRSRLALPAADADGAVVVRVGGLPPTLDAGSLRGRVLSGPTGLRVADVRLDVGASLLRGDETPGPRLDLEDAEDRQARLRDRRDRLTAEIDEVAGFRAESPQQRRGDPPRWAPVESILALAGFVDKRLAALHTRLRTTEDDLERADHEVDVLRHRLHLASTAEPTERSRPTVTAVLTLVAGDGAADGAADGSYDGTPPSGSAGAADPADEGTPHTTTPHTTTPHTTTPHTTAPGGEPSAGGTSTDPATTAPADGEPTPVEAELELEYHVPGATWAPVYQLRLDGSSGAGSLVLRACVAQRTGEDWTGVHLGLSTADLLRRADLPELRSLRIGRTQPEPAAPGWREPPAGLEELFAGYDTAAPPALQPPPVARRSALAVPMAPFHAAAPVASAPAEPAGYGPTGQGYGAAPGAPHFGSAAQSDTLDGSEMAAGSAFPQSGSGFPPPPEAPRGRRYAPHRSMPSPAPSPAPGGGPGAPALQPPLPARLSPSADLLDYTRLTLAGPDATEGRGTLRPGAAGPDALTAEFRQRASSVGRLPRPAHAVDVRVSAGSFDYRFDTAAPADVASDGVWHTVPVSEVPVRTEFGFTCVPAQDTSVFGTVLVTNTSAHPLLAGPADVMVDGDFVLTAPLPTLAPGQREAVGVGVAESVQVARRTHLRESTAGMRGGTTVLDHTVEVEVANRLPYPVVVEVRERVPVSNDKDVRIEERRAQPPWTEPGEPLTGQDGSFVRGARVWRVTLEPGRTATLSGGYEVRLPVGKSVVGGNRRI